MLTKPNRLVLLTLSRRTLLLVGAALCLLAAAALATTAHAVSTSKYTLPNRQEWPSGYLSSDQTGRVWLGPVLDNAGNKPELLEIDPASNQMITWSHSSAGVFQPACAYVCGETAADGQGKIWFKGGVANGQDLISRLDPGSGLVIGWPAGVSPADFAPDGQSNVWLNLGNKIGRINSTTNVLTTWSGAPYLYGMGADGQGRGWFVEQATGGCLLPYNIAMIDPSTNTKTTWPLPGAPGPQFQNTTPAVYSARSIAVGGDGRIWMAVTYLGYQCTPVGSAVVVLDPNTNQMGLWPCPSSCIRFRSISLDGQGKAWLAEESCPGGYGCPTFDKVARLDLQSFPVSFIEYQGTDLLPECVNYGSAFPFAAAGDPNGNGWISYYNGPSGNVPCSPMKVSKIPGP
jgi:streptogramin lyase